MSDQPAKPLFRGKVYDRLKWTALIAIPATSALYATLAGLWEWGYVTQVVGTLAAVGAFVGVLLGISSVQYKHSDEKYDGTMTVTTDDDGVKKIDSQLHKIVNPLDIDRKKELLFKVKSVQEPSSDDYVPEHRKEG